MCLSVSYIQLPTNTIRVGFIASSYRIASPFCIQGASYKQAEKGVSISGGPHAQVVTLILNFISILFTAEVWIPFFKMEARANVFNKHHAAALWGK